MIPFLVFWLNILIGEVVAVRIRMTRLGRRHRPYYRIVATDSRSPRDGKYLEELGSYNPMNPNKDERVTLKSSRIKYWLGIGAQASPKVAIFLKKYLEKFAELEAKGTEDASAAAVTE